MRFVRILALMVVVTLLASACGAATVPTGEETTDSGQRFQISLPRLVIDVDDNGAMSVGGLSMGAVNKLLPGLQLPETVVDPYYVNWMKNTNVQHIELVSGKDGIYVFINGEAMPYLTWEGDSLKNLGTVMGLAGLPYGQLITKLMPIIQRTGVNVVVKFPAQEGAAEIAMRDPTQAPQAAEPVASDQPAALVTKVDVNYDENGVPMLAGMTTRDLAAAGLYLPLELTPQTLAQLKTAGVTAMEFKTTPNGVVILVNGEALPQIAWNDALLNNGANMYAQINPDSPYIALAKLLVPELDNMDIDLKMTFPGQ
jgi:sulfur carrier protein ThiS